MDISSSLSNDTPHTPIEISATVVVHPQDENNNKNSQNQQELIAMSATTTTATSLNSNNNNNNNIVKQIDTTAKKLSSDSNSTTDNNTKQQDNNNMTSANHIQQQPPAQQQQQNQTPNEVQEANDVVPALPRAMPIEPELHELQTEWSLWLYTNNKSRKWDENLQHVISFKTVEEFWAVYNHIQLSSKLSPGHDYALFRAGTRPAWEDEANKTGGRWMLSLNAKQHRIKDLDRLWLELMLLIIGEDFDTPEQSSLVVGAVVSIRFKEDRIALWTGDSSRGIDQQAIGNQYKARLGIQSTISFERHADSAGGPKHKHKAPMYQV